MRTRIQLGNIGVDVLRKDIKNVHLSVHPPTGRVRIAAPERMSLEKCAKNQPAAFCKMYALLVPREMKVEHSPGVASLTDEQLETAIAAIREMFDQREKQLDAGQLIEGRAEPVTLPAPTSKGKA
jgi:hypothetical protein